MDPDPQLDDGATGIQDPLRRPHTRLTPPTAYTEKRTASHAVMEMVVVKWACGVVGAGASWLGAGRAADRAAVARRAVRLSCGDSVTPGPGFVSGARCLRSGVVACGGWPLRGGGG